MPLGLNRVSTRWSKITVALFVFLDRHGIKRQQVIYPTLANEALFTSELGPTDSNADDVQYQATEGTMSFTLQGRAYSGFLDYHVVEGEKPSSGVVEFAPTDDLNDDGIPDIQIIYPDGQQQSMYVTEEDDSAEAP